MPLRDACRADRFNPHGLGMLKLGYAAAVDAYYRGRLHLIVKKHQNEGKRGYTNYFIKVDEINRYNG